MSFWTVPRELFAANPLLLGGELVEQQQPRCRRINGHRRRHLVQRDVLEQQLHVRQRVDGDTDLADLPLGHRVVGVVTHLGDQVESHREPGLAGLQQLPVALVGLGGGGEAGVLAHGPMAAAVHVGVDAAGEGELAGRRRQILGQVLAIVVGLERQA